MNCLFLLVLLKTYHLYGFFKNYFWCIDFLHYFLYTISLILVFMISLFCLGFFDRSSVPPSASLTPSQKKVGNKFTQIHCFLLKKDMFISLIKDNSHGFVVFRMGIDTQLFTGPHWHQGRLREGNRVPVSLNSHHSIQPIDAGCILTQTSWHQKWQGGRGLTSLDLYHLVQSYRVSLHCTALTPVVVKPSGN